MNRTTSWGGQILLVIHFYTHIYLYQESSKKSLKNTNIANIIMYKLKKTKEKYIKYFINSEKV